MPTAVVMMLFYFLSLCAQITLQQQQFYWAVAVGRHTGVFDNWPECMRSVADFNGAVMRSFNSREAANEFLQGGSSSSSSYGASGIVSGHAKFQSEDGLPVAYTDGSSTAQGDGIGVFWGDNHPMNLSESVEKERGEGETTRPEYLAVIRAMETALNGRLSSLVIRTDFQTFVEEQENDYIEKWKRNGWRNKQNRSVSHTDLLERIDQLRRRFTTFRFEKVQAHSGDPGNNNADRLSRIARGHVSYYVVPNYGVYTTHKQWPEQGRMLNPKQKSLDMAINKYREKSN